MKFVAVNLQVTQLAFSDKSDPSITGTIVIIGIPSLVHKVNGQGFCYDGFQINVLNITAPALGATTPDPLTYPAFFSATATKEKELITNKNVLRVDDKTGIINANPINPSGPTPVPVSFRIQIVNAGQIKVQCN